MSLYLGDTLISGAEQFVGESRNIGQIIPSTIPLTDAGLHLLDGTLILGSGIYSAFVTYIAGLVSTYPDCFETEANWQSAVTTNGVCGKFVYDSVNNTVRLPKYSNKIYTKNITSTAPVIGNGQPITFRNAANTMDVRTTYRNLGGSGLTAAWYNVGTSSLIGADAENLGLNQDSTKSGIIANLANITTSLDGYYYIVIATSTKTEIEVDIDQVTTDLNGKADVDLTNVNNTGKIAIAHNTMPSNTYVDLTAGASGTSYTAPSDGWLLLNFAFTGGGYSRLDFTDYPSIYIAFNASTNENTGYYIPLRKGQVFTLTFATCYINTFRFIYAVGSESEAQ